MCDLSSVSFDTESYRLYVAQQRLETAQKRFQEYVGWGLGMTWLTNNCQHPHNVRFNPATGVVQCFTCGCVWTPIMQAPGEPYHTAVCREVERLQAAAPTCEEHEWMWPWSRNGY
jgi:hypothetical protein